MMQQGAFYIDHDPSGQPYLGFAIDLPGASLSLIMCDKMHAAALRDGIIEAVNQLLKTMPKIQPVEGVISDGIRPAQGRQQRRQGSPRS